MDVVTQAVAPAPQIGTHVRTRPRCEAGGFDALLEGNDLAVPKAGKKPPKNGEGIETAPAPQVPPEPAPAEAEPPPAALPVDFLLSMAGPHSVTAGIDTASTGTSPGAEVAGDGQIDTGIVPETPRAEVQRARVGFLLQGPDARGQISGPLLPSMDKPDSLSVAPLPAPDGEVSGSAMTVPDIDVGATASDAPMPEIDAWRNTSPMAEAENGGRGTASAAKLPAITQLLSAALAAARGDQPPSSREQLAGNASVAPASTQPAPPPAGNFGAAVVIPASVEFPGEIAEREGEGPAGIPAFADKSQAGTGVIGLPGFAAGDHPRDAGAGHPRAFPPPGQSSNESVSTAVLPAFLYATPTGVDGGQAPAVEGPSATVTTGDAALARQVVRAISLAWRDQAGEARIRLSPEHLGDVTVSLRVERGTVSAVLQAETQTAREWIRQHEADLRQGLEAQGLHLESLIVTDERERRGQQEPQPRPRRVVPPRTSGRQFEVNV